MALLDLITVGNQQIIVVDADPTITGVDAPTGSLILLSDGSGTYIKTNTGTTNWSKSVSAANLADITTVGTITSGTWQGTAIANAFIATALTGKTYNGLTVTSTTGTLTMSTFTLTATGNGSISGTNTGDQTITLTSEATGSGTGSFAVTLSNAAVIGKVLTGYTSGAGTVAATDTILQAIQKLNGNITALGTPVTSVSGTTNRITSTGGTTPVIDIAATYVGQTSITTLGTIATGTISNTVTINAKDSLFTLQAVGDTTKQAVFSLANLTTATTRTLTLADFSGTFVLRDSVLKGTLTTTDATVTTYQTIATASDVSYLIRTYVISKKTAGAGTGTVGATNTYVRTFKVKNVAGTLTVGTFNSDYTDEEIVTHNVTVSTSGTNILLRATGSVTNTVSWTSITEIIIL